ncbi:hypothetical protein MTR_1g061790 [Medicago truncatula]|uniref:Uncharacterized protein n=1 Tax=Medicago truncatula TaxID=3880 RepID=G7I9D5_MEDTR|nr:hypothetical protein MTR_1g061790 [Medicago truncatula]
MRHCWTINTDNSFNQYLHLNSLDKFLLLDQISVGRNRTRVFYSSNCPSINEALINEALFVHASSHPSCCCGNFSILIPKERRYCGLEISSGAAHPRLKQQRKFSILDRTEVGLLHARAAIREASNMNQTQDPDYVPIGPMYWNAKAFHIIHRSYLEMQKQFKLFVYIEGDISQSVYSMEGNFIHVIKLNDKFRTGDS